MKDKTGRVIIIPANPPAGDHQEYFKSMLDDINAGAGDLTIKAQNDFLDYVTNIATLGFCSPRTVILEGRIIKYNWNLSLRAQHRDVISVDADTSIRACCRRGLLRNPSTLPKKLLTYALSSRI